MKISINRLFFIIALFLIAGPYIPLLFNNLPPIIRSHHIWTIAWFISLLLFYPRVFTNKLMLIIIGYGFFLFLGLNTFWSEMDAWNVKNLYFELYEIFIGASVIIYFTMKQEYKNLAKIVLITLIFIVITSIMTIYSSSIDPMYARNMTGAAIIKNKSEIEYVYSFKKYGGSDYSSAIALMAMIPILAYIQKNRKTIKIKLWIMLSSLILVLSALISIQIFANVLIAFIAVIFSFIGTRNNWKTLIISFFVFMLIVITPRDIYIKGLYKASNWFETDSEMYYKLNDIAAFIEAGAIIEGTSTETGSRAQRYPALWKAFIERPIGGCYYFTNEFKNNYDVMGVHLHWMNKLTVTGIMGFIFFALILNTYMRQIIKKMDKDYRYFFLLATFSILSYGFLKTLIGRHAWYMFFVIIPGINYLPLLFNKKIKNIINKKT